MIALRVEVGARELQIWNMDGRGLTTARFKLHDVK
jgi:hypothetical protein